MGRPRVDPTVWNLSAGLAAGMGVPMAVLVGCGPIVAIGGTDTDSSDTTDSDPSGNPTSNTSPSTTSPSTTSPSTTSPTECTYDEDCPPAYHCDNNKCYYDGYCNDGGCCYDECCYDGCYYNECYYSSDCPVGYQCHYNDCEPLPAEVGCESVPFGIGFEIPVGGGVQSLAFIETDGNNERELLVGGEGLTLARIDGTSTLIDGASYPYDLEVRDLDGDGDQDIVMANGNTGAPRIVLNDGVWTAFDLPQGGYTEVIAIADVEGDGFPDVVGASGGDGTYLWPNLGPASWGDPSYIWDPSYSLSTGNLDNDAYEDIVSHGYATYAIYGGLGFNVTELYNGTYGGVRRAVVGNFNGQAELDVVSMESTGVSTIVTSWPGPVLENAGYLASWWPNPVDIAEVADVNLDGYADIVGGGIALTIAYGGAEQSPDTIVCVSNVATPYSPYRVAVGDMSGDGRPDIAVSDGGTAYVMLRTD